MPVPSSLATLSQTPASNSPDGGDNVFPLLDNYLREMFADFARLRDGTHQFLTSVSGTNTITASNGQIAAYVAGQSYVFIAAGANTGAVTLNINGLGAKAVTKNGTTALVAGDIPANKFVRVDYDGTQFQLTGLILRDFLSNATGVAITSADGVTRLTFTAGAGTLVNGVGGVSLAVGGASHLVVNASGTTTLAADAVGTADAPRWGQVQAADSALSASIAATANTRPGHTYGQDDWCYEDKARGLIRQWGYVSNGVAGNAAITFPVPFTTACFGVCVTIALNSPIGTDSAYQVSVSTTGATIGRRNNTGLASWDFYWEARGI